MTKTTFAVKISPEIRKKVKIYCQKYGLKQGYFVEKALKEKLEALEDSLEFQKWEPEVPKAVDFEDYLKKRS